MKNTSNNDEKKKKSAKRKIVNKTKKEKKEYDAKIEITTDDKKDDGVKNKDNKIISFFKQRTEFKVYELLIYVFIIISLTIASVSFFTKNNNFQNKTVKIKSVSNLSEFKEVYKLIKSSYYKKVSDKKLIDGAINGMLEALGDQHTSYMSKSETDSFNDIMNGSYEGIGAEITMDKDNNILILSVFKNSPADEAGLKYNDKILSVNGKSTKDLDTARTVALIKDKNKKTAKIVIERDGKELTFEIEKRIVEIESVESKTYDVNGKKIGYVAINNFANNTYDQFRKNIEEIEKENIKGLVIDVRGNSGGYLHSVTSMLDMFLSKGKISYQIVDNKKTTKYKALTNESRNYPVAVLIDKSSASASEILAIGLKESYEADVVGTNSYGKGTVQITKNLSSGAMIKYTVQKWLSPNGNWINEKGVEPTVSVELSEDYQKNPTVENDNQLKKALDVVSSK